MRILVNTAGNHASRERRAVCWSATADETHRWEDALRASSPAEPDDPERDVLSDMAWEVIQDAIGTERPRFLRRITSAPTYPTAASLSSTLVLKPAFDPEGRRRAISMTWRSRNGARASTDDSIVARSTLVSRSSGR